MAINDWVQAHPDAALAGGVVVVLLIAGSYMKNKTGVQSPAAPAGDLSGLTNGLVYVPTQTSFTTNNTSQQGYINDPNLISVTGSPISDTTTTTTNNPPGQPGPQGPPGPKGPPGQPERDDRDHSRHEPPRQKPPPGPNPPPTGGKAVRWDFRHPVLPGETLSIIAGKATRSMRSQGMPGSMQISWHDIYAHNTDLIRDKAKEHGHNNDYWNWIFPGEILITPRWG